MTWFEAIAHAALLLGVVLVLIASIFGLIVLGQCIGERRPALGVAVVAVPVLLALFTAVTIAFRFSS